MPQASGLHPDFEPVEPAPPSLEGKTVARLPQVSELSADLSAQGIASGDLALDLLLHDIAERALQTTGAGGAAIGLERNDAMVCRAAAGAIAPDLGARINVQSGLTGACVRERKMQWCTDTEHDNRVDAEASRALGVRSIVVVPVFVAGRIAGVLEVFSAQPDAFRDRDVKTLEDIAQWVSETVRGTAGATAEAILPSPVIEQQPAPVVTATPVIPAVTPIPPHPVHASVQLLAKRDRTTRILRGIAIGLTVVLVVLLGMRLFRRESSPRQVVAQAAQPVLASEPSIETVVPDSSSLKPKPESGRRRGPASNAALRSYDKPGASNRGEKLANEETAPPSNERGKAGADIAKSQPQANAESAPAIADQELAAVGPAPLRALPTGISAAVAPPAVNVPPSAISKGVEEGRLIHSVQPKYPPEAVVRHIEGLVSLHAIIAKDGSVRQVKSVHGDAMLAQAAVNAVQQWRYAPYKLNGTPVDMPIDITINFNMPK